MPPTFGVLRWNGGIQAYMRHHVRLSLHQRVHHVTHAGGRHLSYGLA